MNSKPICTEMHEEGKNEFLNLLCLNNILFLAWKAHYAYLREGKH